MSRVQPFNLSEVPRSGRPEDHPWSEWFDGQTHALVRGEDYDDKTTPASFRSTVYSAASRYGVKVETAIIEGDLNVQRIAVIDEERWKRKTGGINGTQRSKVVVRRKG